MSLFKPATKQVMKLRMALIGPSGSGKTLSALRVATGLGCKKIAVIDTENGSSNLYANKVVGFDTKLKYDVASMGAPYLVDKYLKAMREAVDQGYDCIILDSMTHAWAGEGGLLERKDVLDSKGGNSYTNWKKITPEHERFKNAVLHCPAHVIGTMRSKTEIVIQEDARGKKVPVKVGTTAIQRDGFEYEFDLVFDIHADHSATSSKDRTGIFDNTTEMLSEESGKALALWLNEGDLESGKEADKEGTVSKTGKNESGVGGDGHKGSAKNSGAVSNGVIPPSGKEAEQKR